MYVLIANCLCEYWTANNTNILIIENWPILCDIFIFKTASFNYFLNFSDKITFSVQSSFKQTCCKNWPSNCEKHTKAAANNRDRAIYRRIKQISPPVCVSVPSNERYSQNIRFRDSRKTRATHRIFDKFCLFLFSLSLSPFPGQVPAQSFNRVSKRARGARRRIAVEKKSEGRGAREEKNRFLNGRA